MGMDLDMVDPMVVFTAAAEGTAGTINVTINSYLEIPTTNQKP